MTKRSAEVQKLKLLSLDSLKEKLEQVLVQVAVFKNRGKQVPSDLLEKLAEIQRAIKLHTRKYRIFYKPSRGKPQMRK